jgi:3-methyl-2-oxobutanoate hydroxymethyltransferase
VLVCTDLLGMGRGHSPKFAKAYAQLGDAVVAATRRYVDEVRSGAFPAEEHSYKPNRAAESGPRVSEPSERGQGRVVNLRH